VQRSQTKWVVSDGVFRIDPHQHTVERRHRMQHGEGLLTVPIKARRGIRWDHVCEGTAALWGFFPVLAATAGPAALIAPSQTVSKADRIPIVADRRHPSLHHRTSLHAAKFPAPHSSCPPALIIAAWPTTVTRSRWPRALTRSTQNPFSGLWNVTRSTRPAKASVAVVWAIFATLSDLRENRCGPLYQRYGRPVEIGSRRGTSNTLRQTAELSRVKARIKALAEKTVSNGCTEAEAMAAAEMVGRLLERYALSMEEIDVREQRCIQVEVPIGGKRRHPIDAW
jgi:hypothetical protein